MPLEFAGCKNFSICHIVLVHLTCRLLALTAKVDICVYQRGDGDTAILGSSLMGTCTNKLVPMALATCWLTCVLLLGDSQISSRNRPAKANDFHFWALLPAVDNSPVMIVQEGPSTCVLTPDSDEEIDDVSLLCSRQASAPDPKRCWSDERAARFRCGFGE